jgi:chromosome segregation ATPase
MKTISNMSDLFGKLNDLKTLFMYGQKIVPVIQSLVDFMQDTVPLLENINHSIADSTSKIPKASNQISNVTNATELATTEILDLVDVISNTVVSIENTVKSIREKSKAQKEIINEIAKIASSDERIAALVASYHEQEEDDSSYDEMIEKFAKITMDAYNITLSLQVQDITSQQLAAVNHLIESVQDRLASLISDFDENEVKNLSDRISGAAQDSGIIAPDGATFDPNAAYDKDPTRQGFVDNVVKKEQEKTSQDEIDKLFS